MKKFLLSAPYLAFMILFILVPVILVFGYGVTVVDDADGVSFSLSNFKAFFTNQIYVEVFFRSLYLAAIATVICLILGYPVGLILASRRFRKNNLLILLIVIPMWMNLLLRTYAWLTLLENTGLVNSLLAFFGLPTHEFLYSESAIVLGMVYNFLPFMILPIYSTMLKMDYSLVEAAQDLGANSFDTFRKIIFPFSLGGVFTGITMVFMPAVTTFAISSILSGRKIYLIGNLIEDVFISTFDWHFGSTIAIILIVIILLSMAVTSRYEKENSGGGLF